MQAATAVICNCRVLWALMIREMITRYGRNPLGYLWALAEPIGFIVLLWLIFTQISHHPPVGQSFVLFYATGYLAYHWTTDIADVAGRSVHVNRPLLSFPVITALDTIFARFILQALTGLAVAAVILGLVLPTSNEQALLSPKPLLTAFGLASLLGLGIGLINCWIFLRWSVWERLWVIFYRPVFLISCVFFTFDGLPAAAKAVLWWNPIVHLVGLMRQGIYPGYNADHVMPAYVLALALTLIVTGLVLLHSVANRIAET